MERGFFPHATGKTSLPYRDNTSVSSDGGPLDGDRGRGKRRFHHEKNGKKHTESPPLRGRSLRSRPLRSEGRSTAPRPLPAVAAAPLGTPTAIFSSANPNGHRPCNSHASKNRWHASCYFLRQSGLRRPPPRPPRQLRCSSAVGGSGLAAQPPPMVSTGSAAMACPQGRPSLCGARLRRESPLFPHRRPGRPGLRPAGIQPAARCTEPSLPPAMARPPASCRRAPRPPCPPPAGGGPPVRGLHAPNRAGGLPGLGGSPHHCAGQPAPAGGRGAHSLPPSMAPARSHKAGPALLGRAGFVRPRRPPQPRPALGNSSPQASAQETPTRTRLRRRKLHHRPQPAPESAFAGGRQRPHLQPPMRPRQGRSPTLPEIPAAISPAGQGPATTCPPSARRSCKLRAPLVQARKFARSAPEVRPKCARSAPEVRPKCAVSSAL